MKNRIQQILDHKMMTAAQFADKVGIQRSTLSHILNGRNNASTEIISKIHIAFPDLDINWLLFGEGSLLNQKPVRNQTLFDVFDTDLSAPESNKAEKTDTAPEKSQRNEDKTDPLSPQPQPATETVKRSIVKIMVFYSDNTFDTFSSDSLKY